MVTLGLLGDTMLGRQVAERIREDGTGGLVGPGVIDAAQRADVLVANLECCISERGERWPDPRKAFFFRAPPAAVGLLADLGVDVVTLANNHALDFGAEALSDTLEYLREVGIAAVGAGPDRPRARRPALIETEATTIGVLGLTDHPEEFAAGEDEPGVAFADLRAGLPPWVGAALADQEAEVVVVAPHWGPNMVARPVAHVRSTARALAADTSADLVAGHSAHVFHGVGLLAREDGPGLPVCYDLGDFLDDYRVDERLRNDLGLLWLVDIEPRGDLLVDIEPRGEPLVDGDEDVGEERGRAGGGGAVGIEAVPLRLEHCRTVLAEGADRDWIMQRLTEACAGLGTAVTTDGGVARIVLDVD